MQQKIIIYKFSTKNSNLFYSHINNAISSLFKKDNDYELKDFHNGLIGESL